MGTINFGPALELAARYVAELHEEDPTLIVIYATGAGAGLQQLFWAQPGASRTLLDAQFPYSREALVDLIGTEPEQYCSQDTAIRMAVAAEARCRELAIRGGKAHLRTIGIGLTASVATNPPKRGDHHLHIAMRHEVVGIVPGPGSRERISVLGGTFEKGRLTREEEGMLCDLIALSAIVMHAVARDHGGFPLPTNNFGFTSEQVRWVPEASAWYVGLQPIAGLDVTLDPAAIFRLPVLWPEGTQGTLGALNPSHHLLFPGSFDPLHFGHEQMVRHAERMTGKRVVFTMNARHPDKGEIAPVELLRRAEQFRWRSPVLFTRDEPLFIDKARRFPGFGLLIGADVVLGLLNPKYYGSSVASRDAVLQEFHALGTRFYVVGREVDGTFRTLDDIVIPAEVRDLFVPVSGRWDIASRDLQR